MKSIWVILLFLSIMVGVGSCYQMHSDDDLRTVPVTNNPRNIPESGKSKNPLPATGF